MRRDDDPQGEHQEADTVESAGNTESSAAGADDLELTPETAVADSLNAALKALREQADSLDAMPLDEQKVTAAEQVAQAAAELDEQIGSIARSDDTGG